MRGNGNLIQTFSPSLRHLPPSDGGLTCKHPRFAITPSRTTAECHKQVKPACPGTACSAASSVANRIGVKFTDLANSQ